MRFQLKNKSLVQVDIARGKFRDELGPGVLFTPGVNIQYNRMYNGI
jgi:hypothetical protein